MTAVVPGPEATLDWLSSNAEYLDGQLKRLRLLIARRSLWLRCTWRDDPLQPFSAEVVSDERADELLRHERQFAERRFYVEDPEAAAVTSALEELNLELDERASPATQRAAPPAPALLGQLFDLTDFERDVVLLCLAQELDPGFERLYAYVQDDIGRPYATLDLAHALFAVDHPDATWVSFLADAPLRRLGLVTVAGDAQTAAPLSVRQLRLPERIVDYLRGANRLDPEVAWLVRGITDAPLAPEHDALEANVRRWIEASGTLPGLLNVVGPPGAGKQSFARALCQRLGVVLAELDLERLPAVGHERDGLLRILEREAVLLRLGFYVDASEIDRSDRTAATSVNDLAENLGAMVVVGSTEPWRSRAASAVVTVPKPDARAQESLWRRALSELDVPESDVEQLAQQFDFGPRAIVETVAAARAQADVRGSPVVLPDLWASSRAHAEWKLDDLAQRIVPGHTWDELVLPADVLAQLREISAQVANRSRVYVGWGFGPRLSRGGGIGALFAGSSGTGKTMAAEILAGHLELDLYRIDLAGIVDKYIGETEKNLRSVFGAAEQSGAILFFDEADALFGKRTEVRDSHDRYANIEVNYLLQRMEEYRGLAILATNRKAALDRAFLRRLRFVVDFPFPDVESRRLIWEKVFPAEAELKGIDFGRLSRLEVAGGHIRNIAVNGAFLASAEGSPIRMRHLMRAARREYVKLDKTVTSAEFGRQAEEGS